MKKVQALLLFSGSLISEATAQSQCGYNQILDAFNQCYTCGAGSVPSASGRQCVNSSVPAQANNWSGQCNGIQIWKNGQCETCPTYTRAQVYANGTTYCGADTCNSGQTVDVTGVCLNTFAPAPAPAPQSATCTSNQIRNASGCETCPAYTRPQNGGTNCAADYCNSGQSVGWNGTCVAAVAPAPQMVQCDSMQIRSSTGFGCETCPVYTRPQNGGTNCAANSCGSNDIIASNGTCMGCGSGYQPDGNQRTCLKNYVAPAPVYCNERQIKSSDGMSCTACRDYTRAQNAGTICSADVCSNNQIVTYTGQCSTCPSGTIVDSSGQSCKPFLVAPTCTGRDILSADQRRCEACPAYTRPVSGNSRCSADRCASNEIQLASGFCGRCPAGSKPDSSERNCIRNAPVCTDRERLSSDKTQCISCQSYTRAQNNGTNCAADTCYSNQIVTVQGTCSTCPLRTRPSSSRRACDQIADCNARERLSNNSCIPCDPYTRAQGQNAFCAADSCPGNFRIDFDGRCIRCPDFTLLSSSDRSCSEPSCSGRSILEKDGSCRTCPQYTRPDQVRRSCISQTCLPGSNQRLNRMGVCEMCPSGYVLTDDKKFCEQEKPSPPVITKVASFGRRKDVSLLSISPLDRLLNQNDQMDQILVKVGCADDSNQYKSQDFNFNLQKEHINKLTCHNGQVPGTGQVCIQDKYLQCGAGQPYMIELFDRAAQVTKGLSMPPSLGFFKVTKQMMECMVDNKLQIHFQYGKREALSGAVACFDHVDYIRTGRRDDQTVEIQDEIPITNLNICHKNSINQKRCFVYGYQITINVVDSERNQPTTYPMIEPKVYAKIQFNNLNQKMVILPGDQISLRFGSKVTPFEGVRLQPDIDSQELPSPMKERYQTPTGTRLPCNDIKVADSLACQNTVIYCTGPDDRIKLTIQGAGDVFQLDQKCSDFFSKDEDWNQLQNMLLEDVDKFNSKFADDVVQGQQKVFSISEVTLRNKFGQSITSTGIFDFSYSIGWKFNSNEPRCFAGDFLKIFKPTCDLQCGSSQCLLKRLEEPNSKRMLQADNIAGPDVVPPAYRDTQLPLAIPSTKLNLAEYNVPERLLQIFLSNYGGQNDNTDDATTRRQNFVEQHIEDGSAGAINLSATFFQDIGPSYEYNIGEVAMLEQQPPAYVKITKTPKNGDLVVKKLGKQVVINEGDMVEASILKDFVYNQGENVCNTENEANCKDSFNYVSYGEWVGKGPQQQSTIKINPVSREAMIASGAQVAPLQSAVGETVQLTKETTEVKSGTCSEFPVGMVVGLGIVIMTLMIPLAVSLQKIKNMTDGEKKTQLRETEFNSACSKNALKIEDQSSEVALKKAEE